MFIFYFCLFILIISVNGDDGQQDDHTFKIPEFKDFSDFFQESVIHDMEYVKHIVSLFEMCYFIDI